MPKCISQLRRLLRKLTLLIITLLISIALMKPCTLEAHPLDELQISIRKKEEGLSFRMSIARQLLPKDGESVEFLRNEIQKLEIIQDGETCRFNHDFTEIAEDPSLEVYAAEQSLKCLGRYTTLRILKKSDLYRRASITVIWGDNWTSEALEMNAREIVIRPYEKHTRFFKFVLVGVSHLMSGVDHLLFLLTLLIAALFMRTSRMKALKTVLLEISLFTFAHGLSIIVVVSSRNAIPVYFVESSIALTVIFSGLCLLNSGFFSIKKLIPLIIPFGVIHGLGFAEVMRNMGLDLRSDWLELLGFNIGIELAQLLIGIVLVGIMYRWMRVLATNKGRSLAAVIVVIAGFCMLVGRQLG